MTLEEFAQSGTVFRYQPAAIEYCQRIGIPPYMGDVPNWLPIAKEMYEQNMRTHLMQQFGVLGIP